MPIPQVNDRIKEAPAVMLRAVFAGVGQLLLAADKVRARAAEAGWPPDWAATKGQARGLTRWHTLGESHTGTVPLARERANSHSHTGERPSTLHPDSATASSAPEATAVERPAHAAPGAREPAAAAAPAARAEAVGGAPPLPGYDELTLPSLRARLRGFDAETLRTLLAYEKAHAHRDDVITLFERRLAKINAE
jgi:hypothetical protein